MRLGSFVSSYQRNQTLVLHPNSHKALEVQDIIIFFFFVHEVTWFKILFAIRQIQTISLR